MQKTISGPSKSSNVEDDGEKSFNFEDKHVSKSEEITRHIPK